MINAFMVHVYDVNCRYGDIWNDTQQFEMSSAAMWTEKRFWKASFQMSPYQLFTS